MQYFLKFYILKINIYVFIYYNTHIYVMFIIIVHPILHTNHRKYIYKYKLRFKYCLKKRIPPVNNFLRVI